MGWFRIACGTVCVLLSFVFLIANTAILGRYGWQSGTDEFERIVNTVVAGSVPVALAMMPFFFAVTWIQGRWVQSKSGHRWKRGRPSFMVLVGFALYGVFVAFNFMGAIGSIALQKNEFVDRRASGMDDVKRLRETRDRKISELSAIKADRPPNAVQADLDGAKIHRFWTATSECSEARSKGQSRFCGSVAGWRRELSLSEQATALRREIDDIDAKLSAPGARIASADPQSEAIATYASMISGTHVSPAGVRLAQPMVWFLLLELSCMFLFWMSVKFFRLTHSGALETAGHGVPYMPHPPSPQPAVRLLPVEPRPAPPRPYSPSVTAVDGILSGEDVELQTAVLARFWADCVRPVASHQLPALSVYGAYRSYCGRPENGVVPFAYADFLKRSAPHVQRTSTIGGTLFLGGLVLSEPMGSV